MNNRPTLNTLPVPDLPAPLPSDENDSDSPVRGANERQAAIAALLRSCSTENASVGDSPPPIVGVKVDEEVMQQEAVQADLAGLVMSCSDCGCDLTIAEIDEHDCSAYSVSVAEIQLDVGDPTRHQTDLGTGAGESVDSASAYLSPNPQAQKAQKAQSLGITVTAVGGGCFTEIVRVDPTGPASKAGVLVGSAIRGVGGVMAATHDERVELMKLATWPIVLDMVE